MAEREYQRLARTRARWAGLASAVGVRSSLWLGKDHLLCVDASGYAENYKRFYFRDIQGFILVASRRRTIWNWVLGTATILCLVGWGFELASPSPAELGWIISGVVLTLLFIVPLVINNILGPTCNCHVRTAVQLELLPSLSRVRRTRRVLGRLRPLIVAAQGQLSVEDIERRWNESSALPPVVATRRVPVILPPKPYEGPFHLALSWLLLADLPLTAAYFSMKPGAMDALNLILMLLTLGMAIVCLVKQSGTDLSAALKRIPWITMVSAGFFIFVAVLYAMITAMTNPGMGPNKLSPHDDPVLLGMAIVSTAVSGCLGLIGLISWRRFNEARAGSGGQLAALR